MLVAISSFTSEFRLLFVGSCQPPPFSGSPSLPPSQGLCPVWTCSCLWTDGLRRYQLLSMDLRCHFSRPVRFPRCVEKCLPTDSLGESESSPAPQRLLIPQCRAPSCPPPATSVTPLKPAPGEALLRCPRASCAHRPPLSPASAARCLCLCLLLSAIGTSERGCANPRCSRAPHPEGSSSRPHSGPLWRGSLSQFSGEDLTHKRPGHPAEPALGTALWPEPPFPLAASLCHRMSASQGSAHGTA